MFLKYLHVKYDFLDKSNLRYIISLPLPPSERITFYVLNDIIYHYIYSRYQNLTRNLKMNFSKRRLLYRRRRSYRCYYGAK